MTSRTNSISTQGVNSSQDLASGEQNNLPIPQSIVEVSTSLTERTVEVVSDASQAVRNSVEEFYPSSIICTPAEFKKLLSENYRFPSKVIVKGSLIFRGDSSITTLPAGLEVRGNLNLAGCRNLISLPQGLVVEENLNLSRTSLTSLPEGLVVGGYLDLSECINLISLSEGLVVGTYLDLGECINLISLPERLAVGAWLNLSGCTSLTSLPREMEVGRGVDLSGCTNLTSLPSWITILGAQTDGQTRYVRLESTGLSDAIIERLRQTPTPGMQFSFSHAATAPTEEFPNVETALCFWYKEAKDETLAIPNISIEGELDRANIAHFLARLTTTAEYKNLQTRPLLACRVIEAYNQMVQDNEIKARACDLIHQGLTSCDDRIISALEEIELMLLLDKIENTNHTAEELKKLGKSFLLLEMVNAKAKAHKATLTWVDEIEIYLAFQIGMADRFNLPVKTRNMIFRGCAQVTHDQLKAFGDEIEQACDDVKLEAFLKTWSPWEKFQRGLVPAFEELAIADRELADDDICVFSQCAPEQPVLYNGHVYEYADFVQQYRTNGTDPLDRSKIVITQLKRLTKNNNQ